jgi:hypothetical protein
MRKLKAKNLLDLARRVTAMGIIDTRAEEKLSRVTGTM